MTLVRLVRGPAGAVQDPKNINLVSDPKAFLGISDKFGFTKKNELFVGRVAMLGFAAELIGELAQGGKGPLGQLGAYCDVDASCDSFLETYGASMVKLFAELLETVVSGTASVVRIPEITLSMRKICNKAQPGVFVAGFPMPVLQQYGAFGLAGWVRPVILFAQLLKVFPHSSLTVHTVG